MKDTMFYKLLFSGNSYNNESKYLQHKDNAWIGGSVEAVAGKNGQIAVSMKTLA